MGCGGSKATKAKNSVSPANNGGQQIVTPQQAQPQKEETKDEGPLNAKQIQLAKETWELVKLDIQGHGIVFYTRMFTVNPELQQLFSFRDVEGIENLNQDERFLRQAKRVMEMVGAAIDGLDDISTLVVVLKDLGARHVKYNIKEEHYGPIGAALLYTLEKGLGDRFTSEVKEAWTAVYGVVADTMKAGAREATAGQE